MSNGYFRLTCARFCTLFIAAAAFMPLPAVHAQEEADSDVLEEVVVRGVAYGAARAIQMQRDSDTLVTVVSEETLETIAEQSMGEALSRLPGVSIQRDRGEAETITIRGADARLNAVSMNGDRLPQPESTLASGAFRGQRSPRLNAVPSTLVSEIRVYKAVPPNMDGDSIGGAVDVSTKTATELDEALLDGTVRLGYNDLSEGNNVSGEFTWGDRLDAEGNWGLIFTASYEESERGISGLQAEWDTVDELMDLSTCVPDDGCSFVDLPEDRHVISTYDVIWRGFTRTRQGANVTFDYNTGNNLIKFGGWWSDFEDDELRRRQQMRPGATADFTTETTFDNQGRQVSGSTDGGRIRKRIRQGTNQKSSYNLFVEGEHLLENNWEFDWRLSTNHGENAVNRNRGRFEARGCDIGLCEDGVADWTFTQGNQDLVLYTQPAWANDPDIVHIGRRGDGQVWRNENASDDVDALRFDVRRTFDLANGNQLDLEFGYKGRSRQRDTNYSIYYLDGIRADPVLMSEIIGPDPQIAWRPFGYEMGVWGDVGLLANLFESSPHRFEPDGDNTANSYFVDESINAAYLMATYRAGPWTTVVGARLEDTQADVTASDGTTVTNDYDNVLPAIIARYQIDENQIIRAALTHGISRPDFDDLRPLFDDELDWDPELQEAELSVNGGNPDIEPFEAQSIDVSYEYYTNTGGVFSVGAFYKEIENFEYVEELQESEISISALPQFMQEVAQKAIADARQTDPTIPANVATLARFNFQRPVNGETADMLGFEANYQQQFVNLPAPWDRFGVFANYTTIDGDSNITTGVSRDFIVGQFEDAANFQIFYETESFTARLAYNRSGITYRSIGLGLSGGRVTDDPDEDLGIDVESALDLAIQYRRELNNAGLLTVYFDVQNLTDEESRNFFLGSRNLHRFTELEVGGRSFNLGFRLQPGN